MSLFSFIFICPCWPLNFLCLTQILTAVNLSRIKPDEWEGSLALFSLKSGTSDENRPTYRLDDDLDGRYFPRGHKQTRSAGSVN